MGAAGMGGVERRSAPKPPAPRRRGAPPASGPRLIASARASAPQDGKTALDLAKNPPSWAEVSEQNKTECIRRLENAAQVPAAPPTPAVCARM